MLDEYLNDSKAALKVIDQAIAEFGPATLLLRAKAKIYWRRDDHPNALIILQSIADQVGAGNSVERAFALREAAISAAKCDDWRLARQWFGEAQRSAASTKADNMEVMALGLGADGAVAALMDVDASSGLRGLGEALAGLPSINAEASVPAAYSHRVIRHAVLRALNKISKTEVKISGEAIAIVPGCCSNTEPHPSIKDSPLASLDSAWYFLAEAEIAARINLGIADSLYSRLIGGRIPLMEHSLRRRRAQNAIEDSHAERFVQCLARYVDATVFMAAEAARWRENFDPANPPRGEIPVCDLSGAVAEGAAVDAILAFGMCAVYAGRNGKMHDLSISAEI